MGRRDRTRPIGWATSILALALTLTACTSNHPSAAGSQPPASSSQPAPTPAAASSPAGPVNPASALSPAIAGPVTANVASPSVASSPRAPTPTPSTTKPTPTAQATHSPTQAPSKTATPAPPAPLLVQQLASVGNAQQVVIVTSSGWSTDVATLQTFQKDAAGWHAVFPAMAAHIGRDGFSADKREGDLKTPTGSYGFGTMFGQRASPGVRFPYRVADSQSVWVDDPSSAFYNTWQENAALSGEHLAAAGFSTSYAYAVDIAYNTGPVVPGKGSAIFLHVTTGGGTAGCVSIAQSNLLEILRWLDPSRSPIIVMGPTSVIRQY
jgi:L,D-peptidoglycan transpeptidase YkuD (ErfK/YbiS/YcfS/YnhG family)